MGGWPLSACYSHRQTKLWEGNVFTGVCLFTCPFWGIGISGTRSLWDGVGMFKGGWVGGCMVEWASRGGMSICRGWVCPEDGYVWGWVCPGGGYVWEYPPPEHGTWDTMGYSQQVGSTHHNGMLSCFN